MFKYKITFNFNIEDVLEYDDSEQDVEIEELDDECFDNVFDTDKKIKEFEEWYNDGLDNEDKVSIHDIIYDRDGENIGILEVTTNTELKEPKIFADELVTYLFEGDWPTVNYHVFGTSYEDYWDYARSSPEQRTIKVDYDDSASITSYSNVTITKE